MMRENEEASSYRPAVDHGIRHGLTVVCVEIGFMLIPCSTVVA